MWQQITALSTAKYDAKSEQQVDINVSSLDKEQRTQIHQLVKQLYLGKLVSKTLDQQPQSQGEKQDEAEIAEAKKVIRILKPKPGRCMCS